MNDISLGKKPWIYLWSLEKLRKQNNQIWRVFREIHRNRSLKKARKAKRRYSTWYTGGGNCSEKKLHSSRWVCYTRDMIYNNWHMNVPWSVQWGWNEVSEKGIYHYMIHISHDHNIILFDEYCWPPCISFSTDLWSICAQFRIRPKQHSPTAVALLQVRTSTHSLPNNSYWCYWHQ